MLALFFLFSLSSEPVSCDVVVFVASTSPRPHTGDIPSAPPRHRNYRTNPVAATTAATSPFAGSRAPAGLALSHTRRGHTQATLPPSPSLCLVHLKKASDKSFPLFFPFVFNGAGHLPSTQAVALPVARKHPPHLPSRACRPPFRRRCRHNHHHLNASTTGATSPTSSPYNRRHPTSPHKQGVQKVRWPPPFPRDPHLLTLPLCVGRSTRVAAPVAPPGLRAPPPVLLCMPGGTGGTARP